jgi:hypothetical protein
VGVDGVVFGLFADLVDYYFGGLVGYLVFVDLVAGFCEVGGEHEDWQWIAGEDIEGGFSNLL